MLWERYLTAPRPEKDDMIEIDFPHNQSAHCESGVVSNLLQHYGLGISEALAFGIGSGLFFAYLPFIKINKLPLTTYRCELGGILKRVAKRTGCRVRWQKFKSPDAAMAALDEQLAAGTPVGCRTGAYWLPYFPAAFRFHFNMHNLVVYGKNHQEYLISDPVLPEVVRCQRDDLIKARFSKGALAPKGTMYVLESVPNQVDYSKAVTQGIKEVCRRMLKTPGPVIGVRGIRFLANQVEKWPKKLGKRRASLYVGQLIRMQEEIGTGGGGFRFMYAAFLQEAAAILGKNQLLSISQAMTDTGDQWRKVAVIGARICKGRATQADTYAQMATVLRDCAQREQTIYKELLSTI
jgi:hypothetical protein